MSVGLPQHALVAGATALAMCVPISFFGGDVLTGRLYLLWRYLVGVTALQVSASSLDDVKIECSKSFLAACTFLSRFGVPLEP